MEGGIKTQNGKHTNQTAQQLHVLGLHFFFNFVQVRLPEFVNWIPKTRGPERSLTAIDGAQLWRKGLPL